MSLLDTNTFEDWMRRIMERLDQNEKAIAAINEKDIDPTKNINGERLMDNQDLCQLLQISKRSLQRYRSSGDLPYHMLRHKVYYKESDVQLFMQNHLKSFNKN